MQFQTIAVPECCLIKLLPCISFEKYIYILALEMASPGNQYCANCIGTLSFPISFAHSAVPDINFSSHSTVWQTDRQTQSVYTKCSRYFPLSTNEWMTRHWSLCTRRSDENVGNVERMFAYAYDTIRYDTIRDAILTCARKPTWVGLIYRTETTTKKC